MSAVLETAARQLWVFLSSYAKFTFCSRCGEKRYCRGRTTSRLTCLDCFDQRGGF